MGAGDCLWFMWARSYREYGAGQTKLAEDYCDEQSNPCQHGIINDFKHDDDDDDDDNDNDNDDDDDDDDGKGELN